MAAVGEAADVPSIQRKPLAVDIMPVTTSLGLILAWLGPSALMILMFQTVVSRIRDPARPCRPVLHIRSKLDPGQRRALARFFADKGWSLRWPPAQPEALDVCIELVGQVVPVGMEGPSWPLRVTVEELLNEETYQRLQRRNEIQMRRRLLSGLERLFKMAAARTFRRGSGVWIAPHLWFIPGISRDTPEEVLDL